MAASVALARCCAPAEAERRFVVMSPRHGFEAKPYED